ncbi:MAG TPA: hypothetical protein VL418_16460 [Devosiaceae bacterium]|nr:hypothetical protein [Devosiaceae bacterium]
MAQPASQRAPWLATLRIIARFVLSIALILWMLVEALLSPVARPLLDALGRLGVFALLGRWIGSLPPYAALLVFAVPFIIIEPIKAFALYWFGVGHVVQGGVLYVLAHLASILIVERIYHAAREPLMRIGWFKRLMDWLIELRRIGLDWVRSTTIWRSAARLALAVRTGISG